MTFEGGVWESFPVDRTIGRITTPYEHYAFSKGMDDWLERHRRYADWEAERIVAYLNTGDQLTPRVARDHPASRDATDERDSQNRRQVFGAGFTSDDRRGSLLSDAAAFEDDDAIREYECIDRVVGDDDGAILELLQKAA